MDTFTTTTTTITTIVGDKTPSESTIELLESRIASLNIALALSVIFIVFIVAFFIFTRIKENKKLCCCSCWHRRKYSKSHYWNEKRNPILSTPKDYYHLSGKNNSMMWTDDEEDDDDLESFNIATHSKSLQRSSDNGSTTLHKHDKGDGVPAVIPHAVILKSMNEEEV